MNREDIVELAKINTYEEFMDKYCSYHLCPNIHGLEVPTNKQECNNIECDYCWKKALISIKFKEVESDIDKQNDLIDEMWKQELETQNDLINGTR